MISTQDNGPVNVRDQFKALGVQSLASLQEERKALRKRLASVEQEIVSMGPRRLKRDGLPSMPLMASKLPAYSGNQDPTRGELERLSPRERQVLQFLAEGLLYKEAADKMGLSCATVNEFTKHIYEKLHVHSRAQAVAKFLRQ